MNLFLLRQKHPGGVQDNGTLKREQHTLSPETRRGDRSRRPNPPPTPTTGIPTEYRVRLSKNVAKAHPLSSANRRRRRRGTRNDEIMSIDYPKKMRDRIYETPR